MVRFRNQKILEASSYSPAGKFFSVIKGVPNDSGLRLYRSYHGDGCPVMHGLVLFASKGRAAKTKRDFGNCGDIRRVVVAEKGRTLVFHFEPHPAFKDKTREVFRVDIAELEKRLARPRDEQNRKRP